MVSPVFSYVKYNSAEAVFVCLGKKTKGKTPHKQGNEGSPKKHVCFGWNSCGVVKSAELVFINSHKQLFTI